MDQNIPHLSLDFLKPLLLNSFRELDQLISKKLRSGDIFPYKENRYTWKSKGKNSSALYLDTRQIDLWEHVFLSSVNQNDSIARGLLEAINHEYSTGFTYPCEISSILGGFFNKYIEYKLTNRRVTQAWKNKAIINVCMDLRGELIPYDMLLYVWGLEIDSRVNFSLKIPGAVDIGIIPTEESDFEIETRFPRQFPFRETKAAIKLRFYNSWFNKHNQGDCEHVLTTFRLFYPAGIKEYIVSGTTESVISTVGTFYKDEKTNNPRFSLKIDTNNTSSLKRFFQDFYQIIPENFYLLNRASSSKNEDKLSIAYKLYREALIYEREAEWVILKCVMGYEALLSEGPGELTYKLTMRMSKLLGLIGFDSLAVFSNMKLIYNTRSKCVHEGHIPANLTKKINDSFGNTNKFLFEVLTYLRLLIVLHILLEKSFKLNDDLIKEIDKAMLSKTTSDKIFKAIKNGWRHSNKIL